MMILREPIRDDPQKNPGVPSSNLPDGYAQKREKILHIAKKCPGYVRLCLWFIKKKKLCRSNSYWLFTWTSHLFLLKLLRLATAAIFAPCIDDELFRCRLAQCAQRLWGWEAQNIATAWQKFIHGAYMCIMNHCLSFIHILQNATLRFLWSFDL